MASPAIKIDKSDVKRWLGMVAIGAIAGGLNAISNGVIPDLESLGDSTSGTIAIGLMIIVDGVRRFLQDTRVVDENEAGKMVVKIGKEKFKLLQNEGKINE